MSEVAGEVKIILAADATSYSAALDKMKAQLKQLEGSVGSASTTTRRSMEEARGTVMVLGEEIGVHLPRHVQRFVAQLPGVATAMAGAFDAVAVFAIGAAIYEGTKKLAEFITKSKEAARLNAEAWDQFQNKLTESNDELDLVNIKLENQIAKLQHKPENKLAEAIAEARVETEKLDDKLQAAIKDAGGLLEKQSAGVFGQFFAGKAATDYEQVMLQQHSRWMKDADTPEGKLRESQSFATSLQTRLAELQALQGHRTSYIDASGKTRRTDVTWQAPNQSYSSEIDAVRKMMEDQSKEQHGIGGTIRNTSDSATQKGLLGDKDAQAEAEKAAALKLRGFETQLAQQKQQWSMSVADEKAFWADKLGAFTSGSQQYLAVLERYNAASAQVSAKFEEIRKKAAVQNIPDSVVRADIELNKLLVEQAEDVTHTGERWAEFNRELAKGYEQFAVGAAKFAELKARIDASTGAITRHAEALQVAKAHQAEFDAQRGVLQGQLAKIGADSSLTPVQQATQTLAVGNQLSALGDQFKAQQLQDQAAISATTALVKFRESILQIESKFTDLGSMLGGVVIRSLDSFNETLVRVLSSRSGSLQGQHVFRQLGTGIFRDASSSGLQFAEGSLMKAFGVGGKLGASESSAMWVRIAGGVAAGAQGIGSFFSKIGGIFHLPGFADGGSISSNMPAIVGESGPEIFMPGASGSIIPNSRLGGGGDTHVHIDARGSSDPSAVQAAVARSMMEYLPHLKSHAVAAIRDDRARRPSRGR